MVRDDDDFLDSPWGLSKSQAAERDDPEAYFSRMFSPFNPRFHHARPTRYAVDWASNFSPAMQLTLQPPVYAIEIAPDSDIDVARATFDGLEGLPSANVLGVGGANDVFVAQPTGDANARVTIAPYAPWTGFSDKPVSITQFYGDAKNNLFAALLSLLVWHEPPPPWYKIVPRKRIPGTWLFGGLTAGKTCYVPAFGRRGGTVVFNNNDGLNAGTVNVHGIYLGLTVGRLYDENYGLANLPALTKIGPRDLWKLLPTLSAALASAENVRPHFFTFVTGGSTSIDIAVQLED